MTASQSKEARIAAQEWEASEQISPLPWYPGTKDIRYHPLFKGAISRWAWRFYTHRLTRAGRWFLLLTVIFMTYGSNSLELQAYIPYTYMVGIWVVAIVAAFLYRPRVALKSVHADRIGVGQTLTVEVEVEQQSRRANADVSILPDRLPLPIDAIEEDGVSVPFLEPGQKARVRVDLKCRRRGMYQLKGFRAETDFPFGLIRSYRTYRQESGLLVYPNFTPLTRLDMPMSLRYQPGGVAFASHLGDAMEYLGNREYREGDNVRDIDWRATARLNMPIVREYVQEYFLRVGVILDTHVPPKASSVEHLAFERAVSLGAAVSDYMARQEYLIDLFAAGPTLYHLTAGRSLAYLDQILDILACVEENPTEPFEALEAELLENLAQITTIVCIFLDWNPARQEFAYRLRQQGAAVKVIIVRDTPCTLEPDEEDLVGPIAVISQADYTAGIEEL